MPLAIAASVDEVGRDLHGSRNEMAPLAPGRVPAQREQLVVDENLDFALVLSKDGVIIEIVELAQRHRNRAPAALGQERENSIREEDISVLGALALDKK